MEEKLSCGVSIHEEMCDGKNIFIVDCPQIGVSDFRDNVDEALDNLKKGISLLLEEAPEKRELIVKPKPPKPILTT